jgi:release factor glutamine methyltransferase
MTDSIASYLHQVTQPEARAIPRIDAEFLMAHVLGKPRSWLYAFSDALLTADQQQAFTSAVNRRLAGEPVAYITGARAFWSFDLHVTPDTLIPRPETELLVEWALSYLHPAQAASVLDLGCGSGAIALAIASERPLVQVTAVDYSAPALAVASANARQLKLANVMLEHSDWFSALGSHRYNLIVSNPPYIESADPHLQEGDLRFEPNTALAAGADGLDALRRIVAEAPRHLLPGGWLLVEHGWRQGESVRDLFAQAGFHEIRTEQDLEQRDRVTLGFKP